MTVDKTKWPFTDKDLHLHELGHDMWWSKICDADGNWIGILEWHECPAMQNVNSSGLAAGGVNFDNAPAQWQGPRWQLQQEEPLTIHPSILCRTCGRHGWIQNGRWVPA